MTHPFTESQLRVMGFPGAKEKLELAPPRAWSAEELREAFMDQMREIAKYWAELPDEPDRTIRRRCEGVAFSILALLDGTNICFPAFDLVARTCPEDKEFYVDQGENWIEDGTVINADVFLHDEFYVHTEAQ